jgi:hypothetical protein
MFICFSSLICFSSRAYAQIPLWPTIPVDQPWIAQYVFAPVPLPQLKYPGDQSVPAPEDLPVKVRQQPGYEPIGMRAGAWMFDPSLLVGEYYDSNVFSSNSTQRSDYVTVVAPTLRAHSLWDDHGLDIQAGTISNLYANNTGLNQTDANIRGRGWWNIQHDLQLLTSFQTAYLHDGVGTLSSPANAVQPTPYTLNSVDVTLRKQFNRLTGSLGMRIDSYDYGSTVAQNGTPISQDQRDGQIYWGHGRLDYAISPKFGVFAAGEVNHRDIRGLPGQTFDSNGYRVLAGVNMEFTRLITGEFGAGYVQQNFVASTIPDISGPAYRALLTWRPTRSVDVNFMAEQIVTQTSPTMTTGIIADLLQLAVDYEFRRNVVLSVAGARELDKFVADIRRDQVYTVDTRLKYNLDRVTSVAFWHKYIQRDSNIPAFSYQRQQVGINVTAQF